MRFEWLKEIVGEGYTEEMDKKIAEKIGEGFVAKAPASKIEEEKAKKVGESL